MKLLYVSLTLVVLTLQTVSAQKPTTVFSRSYCTEIGRFDLLFDADEISGSYSLLPKKSLGAIWGNLRDRVLTGRWLDADGEGDIILTFNEDFSFFTAEYRSDDEPEKWYRDSWHGALRQVNASSFEREGKTYRCQ